MLYRDQESSTSTPATSSAPPTSAPSQSSPVHGAPTAAGQLIGNFDEFDPRSSVTGANNFSYLFGPLTSYLVHLNLAACTTPNLSLKN